MDQVNSCPQCQGELPADTPAGLCPKCLLGAALVSPTEQETIPMNTDRAPGHPLAVNSIRYFGDYEILEEIARGGMGVVYKARQTTLNRIVALKMILSGELATSEDIERFHLEAQAAANLNHPNIVAIHEVGQHEDRYYFSMDYVEGQSLGELLLSGPIPVRQAAEYVQTISEAVHYAHEAGTLHRDLKPRNVLVSTDGQLQVTDFGVAKRLSEESGLTVTGAVVGTPSYMAPEQAKAQHSQIGPASDVYSLGAVLYELLTGRPPFYASSTVATLLQVVNDSPPDPRTLNPDLPDDLATICLKCLEKSPQLRYSSAQELADDLGRFLAHQPIHARPASSVRKLDSWFRQRPWLVAAAASLVILLLVAVVCYQYQSNQLLQYQQDHPDYVPTPGQRLESLEHWLQWYQLAFFAMMLSYLVYVEKAFRLTDWRQWLNDFMLENEPSAVRGGVRGACLASCLLVFFLGLVAFGKVISVHVWEGQVHGTEPWGVVLMTWFSVCFLARLGRDYRQTTYGKPVDVVEDEIVEEIRNALLSHDLIGAIKSYRRALPHVGLLEARRFVRKIAAELSADQTEAFVEAAVRINWRCVFLCLFLQLIGVCGIVWLSEPLPFGIITIALIGGFLVGLGSGLLVLRRIIPSVQRRVTVYLVLSLLGFVVTVAGPMVFFDAAVSYSPFVQPWGLGAVCGVLVLVSAVTPGRVGAEV
jgi:serine/threonine protein kinase